MNSVDWGQELTRVKREAEELATSDNREAMLRAGAATFARMLIRTGALTPDDRDLALMTSFFEGDIVGYEIGSPVVQYGPCYLHPVAWLGKNDTRIPTEQYQVMVGVVETPIVATLDLASGQWRATKHPQDAGWVAVATSELADVARHLRQIVIRSQARVAYDREWQATHPENAVERGGAIVYTERCITVWEAGLHELAAAYGAVLSTPEANVSADELDREVREMRRSLAVLSDLLDYVRAQQSPPTPKAESSESA